MLLRFLQIIFCLILFSSASLQVNATPSDTIFPIKQFEKGPAFLTKNQMLADLEIFEQVLRESYAQVEVLRAQGHDWDNVFSQLRKELLSDEKPLLTQHFQKKLIDALSFTRDSSIKAEVRILNRDYVDSVESFRTPYYALVNLALVQERYRALPSSPFRGVANEWFVGCRPKNFSFFPLLPERKGESLYVFGVFVNDLPEKAHCIFVNALYKPHEVDIPWKPFTSGIPDFSGDDSPIFQWKGGLVPYVRWFRDGRPKENETTEFLKIARKLRSAHTMILDVRYNRTGTYAYIENWLQQLTQNTWKNVVLKEKLSVWTLRGLLNRLQWMQQNTPRANENEHQHIAKKKQQITALLQHMQTTESPNKWVETKFIFIGDKKSPPWNKKLIVIANQECGSGCQFLAALAKQQESSFLLGENTGTFPKIPILPLFQLPNSKIQLSISHMLHLDHEGKHVPPTGYEPDYWLTSPFELKEVSRFARSLIAP